MIKKCLLTLVILLLIALPAYAWQLQTRVATVGGNMTVNDAAQTSANGTMYKTLANEVEPEVIITAASGYKISSISINGQIQSPLPVSPADFTMGLVVYPTMTTQSVLAYFAKETYALTTVAGTGGTVNPVGTSNVQFGTNKIVIFSPLTGKNVVAIDGYPAGTVFKNYETGTVVTLPAPLNVKVSATFGMPAEPVTLTGFFVHLTAITDGPKTVLTNTPVTLTATADSVNATFAWSQTGGPGYAPQAVPPQTGITGSGATLTFTPAVNGTYNFRVVAMSGFGSSTASTYVVATDNAITAAETQCNVCHLSRNLGQIEMAEWSASPHAANQVMCYDCHVGAGTGGNPGVLPTEATCAGCHIPLPHGEAVTYCLTCHAPHSLAGAWGGAGCTFCHGYPPTSGAHAVHFGLTDASGNYTDLQTLEGRFPAATAETAPAVYAFGCANCHSADPARHMNGPVDVILYEAIAEPGSLKARAAASAAYDTNTGTCNGVYCHSSGQTTPSYQTTPAWNSGEELACSGCHGNPPIYPSGGAGTATANSHVGLAGDGWEWGHFLSTPGPWHSNQHGNSATVNSSPLTCQTCHYETTDPSNTGPDNFYYLDTTGSHVIEGSVSATWYKEQVLSCSYCHNPGSAKSTAVGTGKVLPLRHVNGRRDVIFDRRETLPDLAWLPAAPNKPTRPYWLTQGSKTQAWPADLVTWNGTTLSFGLSSASYDPATKTCFNTVCHLEDVQPVWGNPMPIPGQWECCSCHNNYCY